MRGGGFRVWGIDKGPHHRNRPHARGLHRRKLLGADAANGHLGVVAQQARIHTQPAHTLRGRGHLLEGGREYGAHGDVAGAYCICTHHFCVAMGADTQAQARSAQCLEFVGGQGIQIFLAEVNAIGTRLDGRAPMVVDEQQRTRALHGPYGGVHFPFNGGSVVRLEAKLHGGHARTRHAAYPVGVGQHSVQAQVLRAWGERLGTWHGLQAKILWRVGPLLRLEGAGAQTLCQPGLGQALRVVGNKAQRAAGLQGCQVGGFLPRGFRGGLGAKAREGGGVVRKNGLRHGAGVVTHVVHGARRGCRARAYWAGPHPALPWHLPGARRARHSLRRRRRRPWPQGLAPVRPQY
ncbi:hypothetical protein D3C71_853430 [compost metagenome]